MPVGGMPEGIRAGAGIAANRRVGVGMALWRLRPKLLTMAKTNRDPRQGSQDCCGLASRHLVLSLYRCAQIPPVGPKAFS